VKKIIARFAIFSLVAVATVSANANQTGREKFPILIDDDDRMTVIEYAKKKKLLVKEAEEMFAATGKFNCPWVVATANLIVKNDIIVTNAHVFLNRKGQRKGNLSQCRFIAKSGHKENKFRISSEYLAGHSKSEVRSKSAQDWIVFRLRDSVAGIVPYSLASPVNPLAPNHQAESKIPWKVTVIAARHNDWPVSNGKVIRDTKSISNCTVRDVSWPGLNLTHKGVNELRSDCDAAPGSSGGAYLYGSSKKLTLVGLITGLGLNAKLGRHKYHLAEHSARGVLLNGAFLKAVQNMASKMGIAEVQEALTVLGYKPGPADGLMGRATRNAIKAFEKKKGLPITGSISTTLSGSILTELGN